MIDSHSHIYMEEFDTDRNEVVRRAIEAGVHHIILPNVDIESIAPLHSTIQQYPQCKAAMGLHPTSVNDNYKEQLDTIHKLFAHHTYCAVGEIGIDLYWDKTFRNEQEDAFRQQIAWALEYDLPLVIHCREAFDELYAIMCDYRQTSLRGIFHSFTGLAEDARRLLSFEGFMLGINGVLTFKKSNLPGVLTGVPLERVVLETDSPYLAPVPHRGKRNESAFVRYTLAHVASVYGRDVEEVADVTTKNAKKVFEKE